VGGAAFGFDANRWTASDRVVGAATLIMMISLFLPWFSVNLGGLGALGTASASGTTAHGWLWIVFLIGLATLVYLIAVAGFQRFPVTLPLRHELLLLIATGLDLLLVLIGFLAMPGNGGDSDIKIGWDFGAFIALIAAIVAVVQPVRAFLAERKAGGRV